MKGYSCKLKNVRTGETTDMDVFYPLEVGQVIVMGRDEQYDDGHARWEVTNFRPYTDKENMLLNIRELIDAFMYWGSRATLVISVISFLIALVALVLVVISKI